MAGPPGSHRHSLYMGILQKTQLPQSFRDYTYKVENVKTVFFRARK